MGRFYISRFYAFLMVLALLPAVFVSCEEMGENYNPGAYVENGKYLGDGVLINGVVWAPVNCGYDELRYPMGKLYQFGRKYGQGYNDSDEHDAVYPGSDDFVTKLPVDPSEGSGTVNANKFYISPEYPHTWIANSGDDNSDWTKLWNAGTYDKPVKTAYDPCPDGWRVPTANEFFKLDPILTDYNTTVTSKWVKYGHNGKAGRWFSGDVPYASGMADAVFFPAAGCRSFNNGSCLARGNQGFYFASDVTTSGVPSKGAYILYFGSGDYDTYVDSSQLASGYSVRCVKE